MRNRLHTHYCRFNKEEASKHGFSREEVAFCRNEMYTDCLDYKLHAGKYLIGICSFKALKTLYGIVRNDTETFYFKNASEYETWKKQLRKHIVYNRYVLVSPGTFEIEKTRML